jgi:hypothetical protein
MESNIGEKITQKIKEGKIRMKSKSYFMTRAVLFFSGIFLLVLFSIYLFSFIIFELRMSGIWFLSQFGFSGIKILFSSLPWILIIVAIATTIALEFFAEKIEFVYKRPAVYSLLGIILFTTGASFVIGFSHFHPTLLKAAKEGNLPLVGDFYQQYADPEFEDFHHGMVSKIHDGGFDIVTSHGENIFIAADPTLQKDIKEGNPIVIIGKKKNHRIKPFQFMRTHEDNSFFKNVRRMGEMK